MPISAIAVQPSDLRPAVLAVGQLLLWSGCMVIGPYMFFRGFRALQLARYVRNVPQSTVRSAAIGPVEICGRAVGPYTLVPPGGTTECLGYWSVTEAKTIEKLCAPLFLDDGTGILMISPQALEVSLRPSLLEPGVYSMICPGQDIFVIGTLQENPWLRGRDHPATDELARIGPGFVSKAEADVLCTRASPLYYPTAPEVGDAQSKMREFDLYPTRILMKGKGPFMVSQRSPRELLSDLNSTSVLGIWGGPALALLGLWMMLSKGADLERTLVQ